MDYYHKSAYAPPVDQTMSKTLQSSNGVVIRQVSQWGEVALESIGVPYERTNKYIIYQLPPTIKAAQYHGDPASWQPTSAELTSLSPLVHVQEESSLALRCLLMYTGFVNKRRLKLHFFQAGREIMNIVRPCRLGGCTGCPGEMHVHQPDGYLGEIREDFDPYCSRCFSCFCLCTRWFKILEHSSQASTPAHKYSLRINACCCGRVNNCCGASCFRENVIIDIIDQYDTVVSTIQMPYAASGDCEACCRFIQHYK